MTIQTTGATTPSEKFSARLSIAARATPASIERRGVAADNVRHRGAPGVEAVTVERLRDRGDVAVEAALREQSAGDDRGRQDSERNDTQAARDHDGDRADDEKQNQQRADTGQAARPLPVAFPVEAAIQRGDQAADPNDRMADRLQQRGRIADGELEQHGDEG